MHVGLEKHTLVVYFIIAADIGHMVAAAGVASGLAGAAFALVSLFWSTLC